LIEPYSLRRTQEGNILLYALRYETNEWRAYRVDRIQGIEITETPFVPKHTVELTPAGLISIKGQDFISKPAKESASD
jgi:predicted DNA-binding transcriptional regulator YafY